jgi:NADH pyrophosphatase NudC (nudix superfamily)
LEETVTAETLAEDEIDCRNLRYSGSRPRPAAASAVENDMMVVVVVVVVKVVEQFEFGDVREQSYSDGICL